MSTLSWGTGNGKKPESLIPDNCGMGAAVGIEMIRETYCAFYRYLCRGGGGGFIYAGVRHYWFAWRKQSRERGMILSANLLWEEVAPGCQRNELASAQFNTNEVLGLLDRSFQTT